MVPTGVPAGNANQTMHHSSLIVAIDKLLHVSTITPRPTQTRWPANGVIVDVLLRIRAVQNGPIQRQRLKDRGHCVGPNCWV